MTSITLVLLTRNEDRLLPYWFAWHKHYFNDILVCDNQSTDDTVNICEANGARVIYWNEKPIDYHSSKTIDIRAAYNYMLDHVSSEWVMSIDADEFCHYRFMRRMSDYLTKLEVGTKFAIRFPRLNEAMRDFPDYQIRFFNKEHCFWAKDTVHTVVSCRHNEKPCDCIDTVEGHTPVTHCVTANRYPILHIGQKDRWATHWQ